MRQWLSRKLFALAIRADTDTVIIASHEMVDIYKEAQRQLKATKRKPGRPLGSKDKAPRKRRTVRS